VIFSRFFDFLFPARCVSCFTYGSWWCEACCEKVETRPVKVFEGLDGFFCLGFYHDPVLRAAIHGLKYRGGRCLLPAIVDFADRVCDQGQYFPWKGEASLSVQALPTDAFRLRERGFDQAVLLRDALLPILHSGARSGNVLRRSGQRMAQAGIEDETLRVANIANVFEIKSGARVPEVVLLLDDVTTSGATMGEAARILRQAGVKRVYGFALALGA